MTTSRDDTIEGTVCPYSIYSLQFFLLFPLVKIGQQLNLPTILSYILAISVPTFVLDLIVKILTKYGCITLVQHDPATVNHPHSRAITIEVVIRSTILGIISSIGLSLILDPKLQQHFVPLGFYLIFLSAFHLSEYFVTSLTNPSNLSTESFLIEHSLAYYIAISSSFLEYITEVYLFNGFKKFNVISMLGLLMALCGEIIRKLAMFTAGTNFSHTISSTRDPNHKLVTTGIYSKFRHPSYAGWFYWAIGTQILLLNPICVVLFAVLSYNFFRDRIIYEEELLLEFFRNDYQLYKKNVGLWMPLRLKATHTKIR